MHLDRAELDELVSFFAKRFSDPEERAALLADVGLQDAEWASAIQAAGARLPALAKAAAARRPKDPNLAQLAETLDPPNVPLRAAIAAGGVLLVIAIGAAAWYGTADEHIEKRQPDVPAQALAPSPEMPEASKSPQVEPVVSQPPEVAEDPIVVEPPALEAPAITDGRCGGTTGTVVGYWYAGFPFDADIGQVYTLKFGKYVRADYPRKANSWSAEEEILCALESGDEIRLSQAPVLVDGGKYWVPLAAGDLLTP
ncbi:MAG TPA: hypothetical protein QGF58_17875 [Myxococcota bacterium]|nr:hypothetical protein [Myxococcota bacterium]